MGNGVTFIVEYKEALRYGSPMTLRNDESSPVLPVRPPHCHPLLLLRTDLIHIPVLLGLLDEAHDVFALS